VSLIKMVFVKGEVKSNYLVHMNFFPATLAHWNAFVLKKNNDLLIVGLID
jgi:hypothetical protein